jgi:hypothetical protein
MGEEIKIMDTNQRKISKILEVSDGNTERKKEYMDGGIRLIAAKTIR